MIIISNKPGQLGNLLFVYANFLAYGAEKKKKVLNPAFFEYAGYFRGSSGFSAGSNRLVYRLAYYSARLLHRLKISNRLLNIVYLDHHESADLEKTPALESAVCFIQGWLFRSERLMLKHKSLLKDFFSPATMYKTKLDAFFSSNFGTNDHVIVALHIRRGDYRTFENGRYYYSFDAYYRMMEDISALFSGKNLRFLICSNEKPEPADWETKKMNVTFAPGHELLDLYCMTRCDYICGPPSTFTMWASFYGQVPLYMVRDPAKKIELADFKPFLN